MEEQNRALRDVKVASFQLVWRHTFQLPRARVLAGSGVVDPRFLDFELNGIRHLAWDAGWGFELGTAYTTGWLVVIVSIVLTLASWLGGYAALGSI